MSDYRKAVQKVRFAAQSADKKIGEIYHQLSALNHRGTIIVYA